MKVIVENLDAFKNWLTKTLSPICDADPQALAKYVLALVKKEKEEQELRDICSDQLDVFLQEKTKEFVEHLFTVLNDKSYIPPPPVEEKKPPPPAPTPPSPPPAAATTKENDSATQASNKPPIKETEIKDDSKRPADDLRNKLNSNDTSRRRSRSPYRERSPLRNRSPFRERSPYRDRTPPRRRVFERLDRRRLSPDRGRTRYGGRYSPERKRRTPPRSPLRRSPPRSPRRTPPRSPLRRSPLRRSPLRRSPPRARSPIRTRSPGPGRPKTRSKSPVDGKPNKDNRSRSLSKERPKERPRSWSRTPPPRRRFRPRSWSMSSDGLSSDSLSRSRSPPRSPRGKTPDSRGSTPRDYSPYNRTTNTRDLGRDPHPAQRARCRDYDEKGFCMRGDLCPYDHGNDPVVVDDVNLPNVLQLNQGQRPPPPGGIPLPPVNVPPPPLPQMGPRGPMMRPPPQMMQPGPMRPQLPVLGGPPPPPPPGPPPAGQVPPGFAAMRRATPPPPGTVPIRMPPVSQGYNPRPTLRLGPQYVAEAYNPEAPSIQPVRTQPAAYYPTQLGPRPTLQTQAPSQQPMMDKLSPHHANLVSVPTQLPNQNLASEGIVTTVGAEPNNRTVILGKREIQNTSKGATDSDAGPPIKRATFDKNRLGPEINNFNKKKTFNPNNCTLELRKVPREMNNIAAINQHFSKFGLITNLQVCYQGDFESALVTFASPLQAKAAHKCTEPIFNNRFVRVFWHNADDENGQPQKEHERKSIKDRLGMIPPAHKLSLNNLKKTSPPQPDPTVMKAPTGLTKTVFNAAALKNTTAPPQPQTAAQQKPQVFPSLVPLNTSLTHQKHAAKASVLQQKKEVLRKKLEIQKKKQQLLQEQLKQQRVLISKIEQNKKMSAEDKNSILKTIKVLADSIEKLKHELLPATKVEPQKPVEQVTAANNQQTKLVQPAVPTKTPPTPTSPEEVKEAFQKHKQLAQKAILDTELDIINKSNEGADTSELRVKVAKLKQEAMSLGLLGRGRGASPRGGFTPRGRGRGRGSYAISHMIDRRPKQLIVMGFLLEEKEDVINHLSSFGEVESVVGDDSIPSLNMNFKTRQDAEVAARDGQAYKKKRLIMTWHKPADTSLPTVAKSQSSDDLQTEDSIDGDSLVVGADELDDLDEDALLGLDEEEEGDADRSWKR